METLKIENFLTIRSAEIEVKDFTIFIGPQGSGKSVIAKLVYFFREFLQQQFPRAIQGLEGLEGLEKAGLKKFEHIFPFYAWDKQEFFIEYKTGDVKISIARNRLANQFDFRLNFSENLADIYLRAELAYRQNRQKIGQEEDIFEAIIELFWNIIDSYIKNSPYEHAFRTSIFIPASRSFFSALHKNIFSFLAGNVSIDLFVKEFGAAYESVKNDYNILRGAEIITNISAKSKGRVQVFDELFEYIEKIVMGEYVYEKEQDWIVSDDRRINLANASSGQQESLPMLIVLLSRSFFSEKFKPTTFFIEEPEAHLFPTAQKDVVELLAKLNNLTGCRHVITTHSPYILTALNNLIYAKNLSAYQNDDLDEKVSEIVPPQAQVSFKNVSAYVVENGGVTSILDDEVKLIGASLIDQVSDQFDAVFSKLLELESEYV